MVGAITFPPYVLSPNTSASCYGPCSTESQYCFLYARSRVQPCNVYKFLTHFILRTVLLNAGIDAGDSDA